MKIVKTAFIIAIAFAAMTSCTENKNNKQEEHGHPHGENGEHLDHSGHDHDENHTQETFEVTSDGSIKKTEESKTPKGGTAHSDEHSHDGENAHKH